ncbi:cation:proton antiporter [Geodermatophilus sp. SYSU D01176]
MGGRRAAWLLQPLWPSVRSGARQHVAGEARPRDIRDFRDLRLDGQDRWGGRRQRSAGRSPRRRGSSACCLVTTGPGARTLLQGPGPGAGPLSETETRMAMLAEPPPPVPAHATLIFLLQLAVLLFVALCLGRLAERVKLPAVVGELLTGVLLGPSLLGHVAPDVSRWLLPADHGQMGMLDAVGQLGVLLLVGVTGSHLDLRAVRRRGATVARISLAGLLLPLAMGIGLGFVLAHDFMPADGSRGVFVLFLGVAMCVSAIPVISKTLSDLSLLHRDVGQLTLAASMVDDAVGWLLLSVASVAATVGIGVGSVAVSVSYLLGFTLLAAVVGGPMVRGTLRLTGRADQPGPSIAAAVILVLVGASTTHALGMEPVFGAFVVGVLIGTARQQDVSRLAPLRTVVLSVLAPLFLATAGLRMDLTALGKREVTIAAVVVLVVAIVGKFAGAYIGARLSRLSNWEGVAIGAGMNARGVIEVIVAMAGLRLGVLDTAMYTIVVLVALVTSLMAPPLLRLATDRIAHSDEEISRKASQEALSPAMVT